MKLTDADIVELALQLHPLVIIGDVDYGRRGSLGHRLVVTVAHPSGEYAIEAFADRLRKIVCDGRTFTLSDRLDLSHEDEASGLDIPAMELCYFENTKDVAVSRYLDECLRWRRGG